MDSARYLEQARHALHTLCSFKPDRRVGSPGNRAATDFLADHFTRFGLAVEARPFPCMDHRAGDIAFAGGEIHISPYSLGCDVTAPLAVASTFEELEQCSCRDALLLVKGELCVEQLMPKNFVFYNPEHHQRLVATLEAKAPAAIITATGRDPVMVGNLYPFPLIEDGDFAIPVAYCRDVDGDALARRRGEIFHLRMDAERIPATACNVIGRKNPAASRRVVVCAHIDTKTGTPGALDNASGVTVLILLADLLCDYSGKTGIELLVFNGEDHYSAGGEMDYLARYGADLSPVTLAVNLDAVGFAGCRLAWSCYNCPPALQRKVAAAFASPQEFVAGDPWPQSDHMVFVQAGRPAVALTSELLTDAMVSIHHTPADTSEKVDPAHLVLAAQSLRRLLDIL